MCNIYNLSNNIGIYHRETFNIERLLDRGRQRISWFTHKIFSCCFPAFVTFDNNVS